MRKNTLWSLIGYGAALGAGIMTRNAARKAYQRKSGHRPPENPGEDDVGWQSALLWGAATGALVGVARIVGRHAGDKALRQVDKRRRRRYRLKQRPLS